MDTLNLDFAIRKVLYKEPIGSGLEVHICDTEPILGERFFVLATFDLLDQTYIGHIRLPREKAAEVGRMLARLR